MPASPNNLADKAKKLGIRLVDYRKRGTYSPRTPSAPPPRATGVLARSEDEGLKQTDVMERTGIDRCA